ncbi:pyruvate decarboxylase [Aspergillus costaricaensis CBS 115574]|uniref:Pyruvate decarboxylase n=1 Tax=Aspergillus costaricaensis CBS 115574 TaxID=1448317 RepID=A0ACD1IJM6_9EURO|nr:pyruvate decarboxylase [Aspergillus costaricaensis CBS 115574]RAK90491.1 pyruvate decarboxylase [Aspergillus costaricaensis CBS 115574]
MPQGWEIPVSQKAYISKSHGERLELATIDVPKYRVDEILVKVQFSGVCHTDFHAWKGHWPVKPKDNLVGGHEGVGIVVAHGKDVRDISIGDKVGIQWVNRTCEVCGFCSRGSQPLCPHIQLSGYTVDGTFQQYCVCKAENAVRIPSGMPLDQAAPILCAGLTVYKALKECKLEQGELVAIAGAGGGLGTLACQFAKACGYRVLAISAGESKRKMCVEKLGADYFVDYKSSSDLIEEIKEVTQGGPNAVIVVSSTTKPFDDAIHYVKTMGTIVAVGLPPGCMNADIFTIVLRNITIKGSYVGNRHETEAALEIACRSGIIPSYNVLDVHELPKVYERMETGEMEGRAVLRIADDKVQSTPVRLTAQLEPRFCPEQFTVGTRLAYRLEELGVTDYFAVPGDFNLGLLDELLKNGSIRMIGCCTELNAGYAADGYARTSPGKVAVVFVTFMVGGLSLINAIAGAYSEGLRVVVISGCPPQKAFEDKQLVHHTLGTNDKDQALQMFDQVTALSVRLSSSQNPAEALDSAITNCLNASRPVYIEIPTDVAQAPCTPPGPLPINGPELFEMDRALNAVDAVTNCWNGAKQPILLVGAHVRQTVLPHVLVSLIDKLGCPVLVQPDGKSLVPEDHPQFLGTFWSTASDHKSEKVFMNSDLWVMVGCRWTDYHTLGCLNIREESHRILDLQDGSVTIPCDESYTDIPLNELIKLIAQSNIQHKGTVQLNGIIPTVKVKRATIDTSKLSLSTILGGIQEVIGPEHSVFADTGDSWFNGQMIKLPWGADYQMQMVYGSIGWSLPATLGYQLGRPNQRVILMIGDGSFRMTVQELSTMISLRLNPIIFVFNNLGYAIETAIHDGPYNYYSNWNYTSLANSLCSTFHAIYDNPYVDHKLTETCSDPPMFSAQIKTTTDLLIALRRAEHEPKKLAFLECCIDPSDISSSLQRFGLAVGTRGKEA